MDDTAPVEVELLRDVEIPSVGVIHKNSRITMPAGLAHFWIKRGLVAALYATHEIPELIPYETREH